MFPQALAPHKDKARQPIFQNTAPVGPNCRSMGVTSSWCEAHPPRARRSLQVVKGAEHAQAAGLYPASVS